jgi:diguanylate cyclase (GGDEF)-like protein/PAS domain S-box-containing protein
MGDETARGRPQIGRDSEEVPVRQGPEELVDDRYLLDALLANTPDHVYFKDSQSRFLRVSDALAVWLGLSDSTQAIGCTDFDYFSEEHSRRAFADEQLLMQTGRPLIGIEEQETWADGRLTWVSTTKVPLSDRNGSVIGLFGISREITERKHAEQRLEEQSKQLINQAVELEKLASRDELTGLYNRRGLIALGEQILYEARRAGSSLGVLFIDVDGMKAINDRFGHRAGDDALRVTAEALRTQTRPTDVAARIGGDEFAVIVGDATAETLANVGTRIDKTLADHNRAAGEPFEISLSVGSLLADPRSPGTLTDLIERADSTMYERKARRSI